MYVPRSHQGFHLRPAAGNALFLAVAVLGTIFAWAAFFPHTTQTDDAYLTRRSAAVAPGDAARFRTFAYLVPGAFEDEIRLRRLDDAAGSLLARVHHTFCERVRGAASPPGDRLAVLAIPQDGSLQAGTPYAELSVVSVATGERRPLEGRFDPLSTILWSPRGDRVGLVRSLPPDGTGRRSSTVVEVPVDTGAETPLASFPSAFEVAPIGYSADGARLFIVVIDANGSTLWVKRDNKLSRAGSLSGGRTRDWSLSPDGARVAYIDVLSASDRAYAGRTFGIATGASTESNEPGNQLGVAWRPGLQVADFGSPAGSVWHITPAPAQPVFVVPLAWSPDGSALAAAIYPIADGRLDASGGSLEIVSPHRRASMEDGARFLGWVRVE